jgi:hypothetical protein
MNRKQRRIQKKNNRQLTATFTDNLTPISSAEFPPDIDGKQPLRAWKSKRYVVQLYVINNPAYPGMLRLSVSRSQIGTNGKWKDGLSWDELQAIKAEVGLGSWYGVEIYPSDDKVINVANMRHIWIIRAPLSIGWF